LTLAEFGIDLAPRPSTRETESVIAAAWTFAVSQLYRRSSVSIEFLNVTADDANAIDSHRIVSDLPSRGKHMLDSLLGKTKAVSTLGSESTQDSSTRKSNQTVVKEHELNAVAAPGGLRMLQRRTYYPYDTVLEWEMVEGKLRFQCYWDPNAYTETEIKKCINDFRQELPKLHSLLEQESQRSLSPNGNRTNPADAFTSEVASGNQSTQATNAVDTVTDYAPDEISASDRKTMLEFNSREIPVATRTIPQLVWDKCAMI
jgi:hypothetical protein